MALSLARWGFFRFHLHLGSSNRRPRRRRNAFLWLGVVASPALLFPLPLSLSLACRTPLLGGRAEVVVRVVGKGTAFGPERNLIRDDCGGDFAFHDVGGVVGDGQGREPGV